MQYIKIISIFSVLFLAGGCTSNSDTSETLSFNSSGGLEKSRSTGDPVTFRGRNAWVKPGPQSPEQRADACYKNRRDNYICPGQSAIDNHAPRNLCRSKGFDNVLSGSTVLTEFETKPRWISVLNVNDSYDWSNNGRKGYAILQVTCVNE